MKDISQKLSKTYQACISLFVVSAMLLGQVQLVHAQPASWTGTPVLPLRQEQGLTLPEAASPAAPMPRLLYSPVASLTASGPSKVMLNGDFTFTVTFDNTSGTLSDVGYGPFIDLYFPAVDGITFTGADYLGEPLTAVEITQQTFPDDDGAGPGTGGTLKHPLAYDNLGYKHRVSGAAGDKLVTIEMPIGSYSPDAPALVVTVHAHMDSAANVSGGALPVYMRGGYQYGSDALDDPCCDFVIFTPYVPDPGVPGQALSPSDHTTWVAYPVMPTVISLSKSMPGSTPTGPNYPFDVTLAVNIASGQVVDGLVIRDQLPGGLEYLGISAITGGCTAVQEPLSTLAQGSAADAVLEVNCGSVTGSSGSSDVQVMYRAFIPEFNAAWAGGASILNPTTGAGPALTNSAGLTGGTWGAANVVDVCDPCSDTSSVSPRAITLSKSSSGAVAPGAVLDYTLSFNISDYFTFGDIVITDVLSDGQHFYTSTAPTLAAGDQWQTLGATPFTFASNIYNMGDSVPGTPAAAETLIVDQTSISVPSDYLPGNGTDGATVLKFFAGTLLANSAVNDYLQGGEIGATPPLYPAEHGKASGTITYATQVQQEFTDNYITDPSIDQGDTLSNSAGMNAAIRSNAVPATPIGSSNQNASANVTVARGTFTKTIYAVNGVLNTDAKPLISSGDRVTYRLKYTMPSADFESMYVEDFFPSPLLKSYDHNGDGVTGDAWSFNATPVALPLDPDPVTGDLLSGEVRVGPDDTLHTLAGPPVFSYDGSIVVTAASNKLRVNIGSYDDPSPTPTSSVVDLLITLTASSDPFADGLYLTNVANLKQGSTNAGEQSSTSNQQVITSMPELLTKKGAVSSDNPNATLTPAASGSFIQPNIAGKPFTGSITSTSAYANSNVSAVDAGDRVKFAVIIENIGSADTYDIQLTDRIPSIYQVPADGEGLNLQVYRGDGTALQWTAIDCATWPLPGTPCLVPGEIFEEGIELLDRTNIVGGEPHPCQSGSSDGRDTVIITYDLQVRADAAPSQDEPNKVELKNYSGSEDGLNFVPDPPKEEDRDESTTTLASPGMTKTRTGAAVAQVGELVQYAVTIELVEGIMPNVWLIDVLDAGLAHAQVDSITRSSANVTLSGIGSWTGNTADGPLPAPVYAAEPSGSTADEDAARKMTLNVGTITNDQRDNTTQESLTIHYSAVVVNSAANNRGSVFNNSATLNWDTGTETGELTASAADATIIEPALKVTKTLNPLEGDANDVLTYTLRVEHDAASDATAYDLALVDVLPLTLSYVNTPTLNCSAAGTSVIPDACAFSGDTLNVAWTAAGGFPTGSVTVITFDARLASGVQPAQVVNNAANLTWTSCPGDPGQQGPNPLATERTGDAAPVQDDYNASSNVDATVKQPAVAKIQPATDQAHTTAANVVVGEIITYQTSIQVPEGITQSVTLVDLLDAGLAFVDLVSIVADAGIETDYADPGVTFSSNFAPVQAAALIEAQGAGVVNAGRKLTIDFNNVRNTNSDNVARHITVTYRAVVLNASTNHAATALDNTATWAWKIGAASYSVNAATAVTVREPTFNLSKTAANGTNADYGNTVTFTLALSNSGAYDAFDILLSDAIPSGLTYVGGSLVCTPGAGLGAATTCSESGGVITAEWSGAGNPFLAGKSAAITFDVTVDAAVEAGATIPNTASLTWTSIPASPGQLSAHNTLAYERTGLNTDPGTTSNDYKKTSTANVTIQQPTNTSKSVYATDQAHTAGTEVAIGEIITYETVIQLPEGVTKNVTLTDDLAQGLAFVDLVTVAKSNAGDISWSGAPTVPLFSELPGGSANAQDQARRMVLDFGDITNLNSDDGIAETITVRYRVAVLNNAGNDGGDTLANSAVWRWMVGATPQTATHTTSVTVREPLMTIAKAVTSGASADAGDPITFQVTINNTGAIAALDVVVKDTLPVALDYDANLNCSNVSGGLAVPNVCSFSGDVLTVEWQGGANPFPVGGQALITFDARVNASAVVGQTITNNAGVTWTSIDGSHDSPRSALNALSDERTANDNAGTTPQDDYSASDGADVTLDNPANQGKEINATDQVHTSGETTPADAVINAAVGEMITYQAQIQFPEGQTPNVKLVDLLEQGLAFVPGSLLIAANPALSTSVAGGFSAVAANVAFTDASAAALDKQRQMTLDFGNITNSDNSNASQEFLSVTYQAVLLNAAGNSEGATLDNQAQWSWTGGSSAVASRSVTVREPDLSLTKTITAGAPGDAGDTVHVEITVQHSDLSAGEIAAADVQVTDTLPAGMVYSANLTCTPAGGLGAASACSHSAGTISAAWNGAANLFPPGASALIAFDAVLQNSVVVGTTITNSASLQWSSLPGNITTARTPNSLSVERTGNPANPGESNPHNASASADLTITDPAISKSIVALSQSPPGVNPASPEVENVVIGETVTFQIVVTLPEGVTPDLVVTDTLPLTPGRLELLSASVVAVGANMTPATFPAPLISDLLPGGSPDGINDTAVFNLGTITNAAGAASDTITLQVAARVLNHADNQAGDLLTNTAAMDVDSGRITANDTAQVQVGEAALTLAKTFSVVSPAVAVLGATIEYTLTVSNPSATGSAAAYNMLVSDTIPAGMTYVAGSASAPAGWTLGASAAPTLTWTSSPGVALALDASQAFTYRTVINSPPTTPFVDVTDPAARILQNSVEGAWTSLQTPDGNERSGDDNGGADPQNDYTAAANVSLEVTNPDLSITKTHHPVTDLFQPNGMIHFSINYANNGSRDATAVQITETVPLYAVFSEADSGGAGVWSCPNNALPGVTCTHSLGVLAAGASGSLTFAVKVDPTIPVGINTLDNSTSIAYDQASDGPDPTPADNSDSDQVLSTAFAPNLVVAKEDGVSTAQGNDLLVYNITYQNIGTQHAAGVVLTDTIPPGTVFNAAASSAGWDCSNGDPAGSDCHYAAGEVNAGLPPVTIMLALNVLEPSTLVAGGIYSIDNSVSIDHDGAANPDSDPANNSATDSDALAGAVIKRLVSIEEPALAPPPVIPAGSPVVIGSVMTYELVITVNPAVAPLTPPSTLTNVTVTDTLPLGMAFFDCISVVNSGGAGDLTTSLAGGFADACMPEPLVPTFGNPAISPVPALSTLLDNQGRQVAFFFDTLQNNTASAQTITITYQVVVIDTPTNQRGSALQNIVELTHDGITEPIGQAVPVRIAEPSVDITKAINIHVAAVGDEVVYTLEIFHTAESDATAYETIVWDPIPVGLTYSPGSLTHRGGQVPDAMAAVAVPGGVRLRIDYDVFPLGATSVIEFRARVAYYPPNNVIVNVANVEWTSLPGDYLPPVPSRSGYNKKALERWYDPPAPVGLHPGDDPHEAIVGGNYDDLMRYLGLYEPVGNGEDAILIPETGFAPGIKSEIGLPEIQYHEWSQGFTLSISQLDLETVIVGVPFDQRSGWNTDWLGSQAGYLEGTVFPTTPGNSVLAGHVTDEYGQPGIFAALNTLKYDDQIVIEYAGQKYIYGVRSVQTLTPNDTRAMLKRETLNWLTLITCRDYDKENDRYRLREMVRAVLLKVED